MESQAQLAHAAWEREHAVNQPPPPQPHATNYLATINVADGPILYKAQAPVYTKPGCEYRKDVGGYYNTCLT